MASKEKVSLAQLRVGILAIVALSCIVLLIFLLTGNKKFFITEVPLHTYVDDAASLQAGAAVRIAGIQAGTVKKVALSGSNDPRRVIRVVVFELNIPFRPAVVHHAVMIPEYRIERGTAGSHNAADKSVYGVVRCAFYLRTKRIEVVVVEYRAKDR